MTSRIFSLAGRKRANECEHVIEFSIYRPRTLGEYNNIILCVFGERNEGGGVVVFCCLLIYYYDVTYTII